MDLVQNTKRIKYRDLWRQHVSSKDWWRVSVTLFFTLVHDSAGLFSASKTITRLDIFTSEWQNMLLVYVPIVLCDCVSEFMLVAFHDLPLVKRKPIRAGIVRVALGGQILTSLLWLSLVVWVVYDALRVCGNVGQCPGLSEALVIILVWVRNSLTLKAYHDRYGIYPIICEESFLFLHHFLNKRPQDIVTSFKKATGYKEPEPKEGIDEDNQAPPKKKCCACMESDNFLIASNYVGLVVMDLTALASVMNLIVTPGNMTATALAAFGFFVLIIVDIASETVILVAHDLPLIRGYGVELRSLFNIARAAQAACLLAWILALLFMIGRAASAEATCQTTCTNCPYSTGFFCENDPQCPGGTCVNNFCTYTRSGACTIFPNGTFEWNPPLNFTADLNSTLCESTQTRNQCLDVNPSPIDCVLLFIVLLDSIYSTIQIWFRSFIYPITLPEAVMFTVFLNWQEKDEFLRHKLIIESVGKMEFGEDWTYDGLEGEGGGDETVDEKSPLMLKQEVILDDDAN